MEMVISSAVASSICDMLTGVFQTSIRSCRRQRPASEAKKQRAYRTPLHPQFSWSVVVYLEQA